MARWQLTTYAWYMSPERASFKIFHLDACVQLILIHDALREDVSAHASLAWKQV